MILFPIFLQFFLSISNPTEAIKDPYEKKIEILDYTPVELQKLVEDSIAIIIDPPGEDDNSWADVGFLNPRDSLIPGKIYDSTVHYYFLVEGDYGKLGRLNLLQNSGTKFNRKHIIAVRRLGNSGLIRILKPRYSRPNRPEVYVKHIHFYSSSYWTLHGITFGRKIGSTSLLESCSNHNLIDNCLFEDVQSGSCMRIRNSNFNTIQNSVFRTLSDSIHILCNLCDDNVGVLIEAYTKGDRGFEETGNSLDRKCLSDSFGESRGNVLVKNKFYDLVDGIQSNFNNTIPKDSTNIDTIVNNHAHNNSVSSNQDSMPFGPTGYIPQTIIHRNTLYNTKLKIFDDLKQEYVSWGENALDIKVGAKNGGEDSVIISNNVMWGNTINVPKDSVSCNPCRENILPTCLPEIPSGYSVRPCNTSGTNGSLMTIHKNAQYLNIKNNHFHDAPVGIRIDGPVNDTADPTPPFVDHISIFRNSFSNISSTKLFLKPGANGFPIIVSQNSSKVDILRNTFYNCQKPIHKQNACRSWHAINIKYNRFYNLLEPGDNESVVVSLGTDSTQTACIQKAGNRIHPMPCEYEVSVGGREEYGYGRLRVKNRCNFLP